VVEVRAFPGLKIQTWGTRQRFYTSTCEVRVNKITGTIVTVISKIKR
jgi:hypothetical protein